MVRMFVRHPVSDFAVWKEAYDAFDAERAGMGVTGHAVYRLADDPNDITIWHDFESLDVARAFLESARLHNVMTAAGVVGEPSVWFTTPA